MVSAKDAGSSIGGFFNNPGIVAIAALGIGLFIFREPITKALQGLGGSLSNLFSPSGAIQAAGAEAGQFVFNIGQEVGGAVFDAGAAAGQSVFDAGAAAGDFFGGLQNQFDQFITNLGRTLPSDIAIGTQNVLFDADKALQDFLDSFGTFGQGTTESEADARRGGDPFATFPFVNPRTQDIDQDLIPRETQPVDFIGALLPGQTRLDPFDENLLDRPLSLFDFATRFNIQPSEAFSIQKDFGGLDFEAIAAIPTFGEVLAENPDLTASQIANLKLIQAGGGGDFDFGTNTGQALELAGANFGSSVFLKREDESFALLQEAEALRASTGLTGFSGGSLFGNPDFPITLGEAFLGKSGSIVSQSISNLTDEQLKQFIEQFG